MAFPLHPRKSRGYSFDVRCVEVMATLCRQAMEPLEPSPPCLCEPRYRSPERLYVEATRRQPR